MIKSSNELAVLELGPAEGFGFENFFQYSDAVPDVGEAEIERGEAETEDVGGSEVADDAAGDERLHDRVALGVTEGDLRAALCALKRAGAGHSSSCPERRAIATIENPAKTNPISAMSEHTSPIWLSTVSPLNGPAISGVE